MPITSIASYGPTMQAFNVNWVQANGELMMPPGSSIVLAGGYTQSQFHDDMTALLVEIETVLDFLDQARTAALVRDQAKYDLTTRAKQFRNSVLALITDTTYTDLLPTLPRFSADLRKFAEPLHIMQRLWTRINGNATMLGLSGALTLQGGYDVTQFATDIAALEQLYAEADDAEQAAGFARGRRDNRMAGAYERMKQYRAAAPAMLPQSSPALQDLPRLTPPPGTTPPAVVVTGTWDAALVKARLSWPASTAPDLDKLQVRGCTSGIYKAAHEEIVSNLAAGATHCETDWGLTVPGALATFKVYVMATAGNENGSKAVKIVQPEM